MLVSGCLILGFWLSDERRFSFYAFIQYPETRIQYQPRLTIVSIATYWLKCRFLYNYNLYFPANSGASFIVPFRYNDNTPGGYGEEFSVIIRIVSDLGIGGNDVIFVDNGLFDSAMPSNDDSVHDN